jgi:S1-C subfamily serine protease
MTAALSNGLSNPLQDLSAAVSSLVTAAAVSVVAVHSRRSRSSGFVWRPGLVVTADEALAEDADLTVVLPGGETVSAELLGRDPTTDIALLRIERSELQPISLGSPSLSAGAVALAVGNEEGTPTASLGSVALAAGAWRSLRGGEIDARLDLDVRLRRRAEGGVALDASGLAFGMAVFGPRRRVLVIPSATIERVAAALEKHGRVPRGYLGLGLQRVELESGSGMGVMVMSVDPKGPGAAAGLRQGDVLVTWDGEPVRSVPALVRALGPGSVGRSVALGLRRGGEPLDAHLTIGERPAP